MELENRMNEILKTVCNLGNDFTIEDSMSPSTVELWDSLANMQLISELEEEFDIEFDFDELLKIEKWGDFKTAIKNKIG